MLKNYYSFKNTAGKNVELPIDNIQANPQGMIIAFTSEEDDGYHYVYHLAVWIGVEY